MKQLLQAAIKMLSLSFANLRKDDIDAIIDRVEAFLVERRNKATKADSKRYHAALIALRAVRGILGVPDDDADQLKPV